MDREQHFLHYIVDAVGRDAPPQVQLAMSDAQSRSNFSYATRSPSWAAAMHRSPTEATPTKPSIIWFGSSVEDKAKQIGAAITELPPRQREAVQHLMVDDRSLADAAVLTGRSKGSLKVNLHRALNALRLKVHRGD